MNPEKEHAVHLEGPITSADVDHALDLIRGHAPHADLATVTAATFVDDQHGRRVHLFTERASWIVSAAEAQQYEALDGGRPEKIQVGDAIEMTVYRNGRISSRFMQEAS